MKRINLDNKQYLDEEETNVSTDLFIHGTRLWRLQKTIRKKGQDPTTESIDFTESEIDSIKFYLNHRLNPKDFEGLSFENICRWELIGKFEDGSHYSEQFYSPKDLLDKMKEINERYNDLGSLDYEKGEIINPDTLDIITNEF